MSQMRMPKTNIPFQSSDTRLIKTSSAQFSDARASMQFQLGQQKMIQSRSQTSAQRSLQSQIQGSPVVQQKKLQSHVIDKIPSHAGGPIQMIAYKQSWQSQEDIYQSNKIGSARLAGDAEWGAIVRFCANVIDKTNKTVEQVIQEAALIKGCSYEEWKGNQIDKTSREAQHLVSSSYATKVLKWPYKEINSPNNFKMLLAGRNGKGVKTSDAYRKAKRWREGFWGYIPGMRSKENRGFKHIKKGIAHPGYSKASEKFIAKYYAKRGYVIGQPIPKINMEEIKDVLRKWHKQGDAISDAESIDERVDTDPPMEPVPCAIM